MKKIIFICITGCLMLTLAAFQQKPWTVPAKNAAMKNPEKAELASIKTGKDIYVKHCNSCHGKKGKGDGLRLLSWRHNLATLLRQHFNKSLMEPCSTK